MQTKHLPDGTYALPTLPQDAGKKFDSGKPRLDLIPSEALEEIGKVLAMGAEKYGEANWANGISWQRIAAAMLRHIFAWLRGEDLDPESGLSHIAHVGANVVFLLWFIKNRPDLDNRWQKAVKK